MGWFNHQLVSLLGYEILLTSDLGILSLHFPSFKATVKGANPDMFRQETRWAIEKNTLLVWVIGDEILP